MKKRSRMFLLVWLLTLLHSAFALSSDSIDLPTGTETANAPVIEDYYTHGLKQITVKTKSADKSQIKAIFSDYFHVSDIQVDMSDTSILVSTENQVPFLIDSYVSTDLAFSWTMDETLAAAVQDAEEILKLVGISYLETPVHACFYTLEGLSYTKAIWPDERSDGSKPYISVCLSPEFIGIPLAQEAVSDRGAYHGRSTAITDICTIDFVFDASGSFIAASFPLLEMTGEQELLSEAVPYQSIVSMAHHQMIALILDTETNPIYPSSLLQRWKASSIDDLLQKYEFRITRIRSVWLDDYQGRLRPGWYARVEVFLKGTDTAKMFVDGAHSYPEIFCFGFDAVDGRPNQSYQ